MQIFILILLLLISHEPATDHSKENLQKIFSLKDIMVMVFTESHNDHTRLDKKGYDCSN
jgi:hypothetical protein